MNDWRTGELSFHDYIGRAQQERADAMARVAYLLVIATSRVAGAALRAVRRAVSTLRQWHQRRRAMHELLSLDDRLLRDMGLTRGDIWAAVHGALPGRPVEPATPPAAVTGAVPDPQRLGGCNDNLRPRRAA